MQPFYFTRLHDHHLKAASPLTMSQTSWMSKLSQVLRQ
jgi:hypothetical protein